jgi:S1-C subfamily serine protease
VVIIAAVGVAAGRYSIDNGASGSAGTGAFEPTSPGAASASSAVASKVDPAVVDITTQLGFQNGEAAGTGMVLTASGEVLTNNHVVAGATSISATDVGNGRTYTAVVVGTDKADDVAVIRLLGASGLKSVSIVSSSTLGVGAAVTAIGNAGGQGGTPSVSTGTVTGLDQSITANDQADGSSEQLSGLIQTDAELQPGDSGGPLVNSQGQVVGMDTAASTGFEFQTGSSQGFAIPINKATAVERQIVAGQASSTVHIGAAAFLGVEVNASSGSGAQVVVVESGTPADHAGIVDGDVIVSLGGQTVDSPTTLTNLMRRHHPGDRVQLGWVDQSGQHHTATVELATGPAS